MYRRNKKYRSKLEKKFSEILKELNLVYVRQYRINNYFYDFLILSLNLLIEVNGDYWHGNPELFSNLNSIQKRNRIRDEKKKQIALNRGYYYLVFWENEINNDPQKVKEKLINEIRMIKKYGKS